MMTIEAGDSIQVKVSADEGAGRGDVVAIAEKI